MALVVNEIFNSIQGESLYSGMPCTFVRLTGCNLRCRYCDTRYAHHEGQKIALDDVLERVAQFGCGLVEVTGGEPLAQEETPVLVQALLADRYRVLLETNGSLDVRLVDRACVKILDIKCPSSDESHRMDLENVGRLGPEDQVKFVIADRNDYQYAKRIVGRYCQNVPEGAVLFSPVFGALAPEKLASWILEDRLTVRLQIQLHKLLWPEMERGV